MRLNSRGLRRATAFSLVELLVTIVLVLIIIAICVPVLSASKASAENSRCIANLKQVGAAFFAYANDNRQTIMPQYAEVESGVAVPSDSITWVQRLLNRRYLEQAQSLVCPSHPPYKAGPLPLGDHFQFRKCYGIRIWRMPDGLWVSDISKPLSAIKEPGKFPLVGDSYWKNHGGQGYLVMPDPLDKNQYFHLRHRKKANFCFADGSVRGLTRDEIRAFSLEQEEYGRGNRLFLCWPLED